MYSNALDSTLSIGKRECDQLQFVMGSAMRPRSTLLDHFHATLKVSGSISRHLSSPSLVFNHQVIAVDHTTCTCNRSNTFFKM